jgi:S-DNA-T family DNA segregation ATPase FtsK/SpoIIIE
MTENKNTWTLEQTNNVMALVQKLQGLDISAKPCGIEQGPVVTAYLFDLGHDQPINRILKRAEDFALSLGADKVVIQRIRDKIAIFVPNKIRETIDYKDILHWYLNDDTCKNAVIPIPLGVDFHGEKSFIDLADMPHMLITGSTGSGKSVFEAAIISSLIYKFDPADLHIYLVDTKQLDLPLFKELPHVQQVAENLDEFHSMMFHIMPEIRRRNGILKNASCRNIQDYHRMMGTKSSMPFIVLMLDEFGDLMKLDEVMRKADKNAYKETPTVEGWLTECSAIARAAGIHIIACTQRADVKTISGTIKTNLPCRIALRCTNQVDSRTILDTGGAENLLGKGDMLVKRPEKDVLERFHGPFVSMNDIQQLVFGYDMIKQSMTK